MPDFDPDKYLNETGMAPAFDPDKYIADAGLSSPEAEDQHSFVPFVKQNAQALWDLSGKAGQGMVQAAMHPIDTASQLGNAIADTSPQDIAAGANRAVRNTPLIGGVVDKAAQAAHAIPALVKGEGLDAAEAAVTDFKSRQDSADKAHAQEHPLTDFIQKSVGMTALPGGAVGQLGAMSADAFTKSLESGNNAYDALRDARNVAALGSAALTAGHVISKVPGMVGRSVAKQAGVSEEAMQDYVQQSKMANEMAQPAVPAMSPEHASQRAFFDAFKPKTSPVPEAPVPQPAAALAVGEPNFNFGKKIGQVAGGAVGGFSFGPAGAVVGRDIVGHAAHSAIDGLANQYGHQAVKMALDGGIALDKLAGSPYIGTIMSAASESPKSLAVAHYLLSQQDPKYQELTNDDKPKLGQETK